MSETIELQDTLDGELAKFVSDAKTPERQAEILWKVGFYRTELAKQADLLASVDEDLAAQVAQEWFASGDELLKRAVWNSVAGSEEIELRKEAPIPRAEEALAKMVSDAPTDLAKAHLLHKIGHYTTEFHQLVDALDGQPEDRIEAVVKAWLEADKGELLLKSNILDAEMPRSGKRIYGQGVKAGDVVREYDGNASTYADTKLQGSQNTPYDEGKGITRSVPHPSKREGGGKRVSGSKPAPGQDEAKVVNPGSGPTSGAKGWGEGSARTTRPETVISRRGTTGGLGSISGVEGGEGANTVEQDDTFGSGQWTEGKGNRGPQQKVARPKRKDSENEKAEFISDLMKLMPDEMVEAVLQLESVEDQQAACEVAADHAADLLAWCEQLPEDGLAKRDINVEVESWLLEDP